MAQLTALFANPATQISRIIDAMDKRAATVSNIRLEAYSRPQDSGPSTKATGEAQSIMFLIGEVAAQGEESLRHVERA